MKENNLGEKILEVRKVTGGLSHRMYKVTTDKAIYAIKELNPNVMKREEAYANFVFAEKVVDIAIKNGISAVGAIKLNGEIMQKIEDDYFMVFDWIDGKVLLPNEINEMHCQIIARELAKIHNIDFSKIEVESKKETTYKIFDWDDYVRIAKVQGKEYAKLLEENCELLRELNKKAIGATKYANHQIVISHRDLDRKNILWKGNTAYLIDWEASGPINPTVELISMAYYWSGGDVQNIDYDKFRNFVQIYRKSSKRDIDKNVHKLAYVVFYSGLEWLEYNLQRVLGLHAKCEKEEIELAEKEIMKSIIDIQYNVSQVKRMTQILGGSV